MLYFLPVIVAAVFCPIVILSRPTADSWSIKNLKSVVTFGDSYTDETRVNYFTSHDGAAPPPGWVEPMVSCDMPAFGYAIAFEPQPQNQALRVFLISKKKNP